MNDTCVRHLLLCAALLLLAAGWLIACDEGPDRPTEPSGSAAGVIVGSGNVVQEVRPISFVRAVTHASVGDLHIDQGSTEMLRLQGDDNILPFLHSDVAGGLLTLWSEFPFRTRQMPQFYLDVQTLDLIELSGAGSIETPRLETGLLELVLNGAGNVRLDHLDGERLDARLGGAGTITVGGTVAVQDVELTGAGTYRALDLRSNEAHVTITGAGTVTVWVTDRLDVTITGPGSVRYRGDPVIESSINGLGTLQPLP